MVLYDRGLPALIEPGEGGSGAECLHPRPEQVARERAQRAHVRVVGHVRRIARRTGLAHLRNRHAQIYFHTVQLSILHGTERSIVCAPLIHGNDQAVLPVACDTGVLAVRRKQPIGVAPSADVGGAAPVRALQGIRVKRIMGAVGEDSLNRLPGAQRSLGRGVAVRAIDREVLEQRTLPQAVPRTALQLGTGCDNGVAANFMHGLDLFIVLALISAYSPAPGGGSRAGGIRTHDLLLPKQARYQAAPQPVEDGTGRRRRNRDGLLVHRAGDGNRTRAICLEGRGSTIELHPRARTDHSARDRTQYSRSPVL